MNKTKILKNSIIFFSFLLIILLIIFITFFYWNGLSVSESKNLVIEIEDNKKREELVREISLVMDLSSHEERRLYEALQGIQWDAFNKHLLDLFIERFNWGNEEKEIFLTHSSEFLNMKPDILDYVFRPGIYEFSSDLTPSEIAENIVNEIKKDLEIKDFLISTIPENVLEDLNLYIDNKLLLLPDLIPLPPQDVGLREEGGRTLLVFSTTYYNIGSGDFELIADPETAGIDGDIEREVFQRIYKINGDFIDKSIGTFLWHEEHLHYHFSDFIYYYLEPVFSLSNIFNSEDYEKKQEKATYCLRDTTLINISRGSDEPKYLICGKERQGVSVGWGDTYFQTYGSQNFDVTELPSGRYRLSFVVNPENMIKEENLDNNSSSALIEIDKENGFVDVVETEPFEYPSFEHLEKK